MTTSHGLDALAEFASPEFQRDPYPFLHRLRDVDPVHRTAKGFYLATRHADASFLLAGVGDLFRGPSFAELTAAMPQLTEHRALSILMTCLMAQNPPEHTRLRKLVASRFTPRAVDAFAGRIGVICDRLLDAVEEPLRDGEVVDLHRTLSEPLPRLMIAELLGVPAADHEWLITAVRDIADGLTAASTVGPPTALLLADEQTVRMENYFRELAAARRRDPGDDLISGLVRQEKDRLTDDELVNLVWLLWLAGTDANTISLDHCVWSLLAFPDQCQWLHGYFGRSVAFVDEVLRRTAPVMFSPLPRLATREFELDDVTYAAGTDIRPVFTAANRDPAAFPDPDRFDPSRDNRQLLTFSAGIHHCLGMFLARNGLATATSRLHNRFPGLVGLADPRWGGLAVASASRSVPVALERTR
ncbi:cytochrome P450 [Kutzneria sp. CA-103260]|uniref:cytochrome P450 n=1 Tax=Kutzneria sp. CA-103260 TaxID=2802641 RepID=UPI001BAAE502|nr:cytochrome P450 [Kutzneria sp. CA-103260]QUQ65532.1 cytochrome P450 [Kutzneria sp. CA-103260]